MALPVVYQRKRALLVGINGYLEDPLQYCINDAEDLSVTLRYIDFDISIGVDCNLQELYNIIDSFAESIQKDDLVLFYFAGHGKQIDDQNYLLPSDYEYDFRGDERDYITNHAINVQYITKKIDKTQCRITIYIFDCCRDLIRTRAKKAKQGLLLMNVSLQTLIVFSCAPGRAVQEETRNNRNGSFIENLLKHILRSHKDIEEMMRDVACDVHLQTGGFQLPYRTSSLTGKVFLIKNHDKEVSSSTASTPIKLYSKEKIRCRGRACATCGRCRDWFWRLVNNKMRHTKRHDATCILMDLDYYENDENYLDNDFHNVCRCDDNRV